MSERNDPGFGMEEISTALLTMLMDGLNPELITVAARKASDDERLATLRGVPYVPIELEPVATENFYLGSEPSLIEETTPLEKYPNVAVMSYQTGPALDDDADHYSAYSDRVYVETMVKASPEDGEEVCNKRIWRQADAVNNVVMRDRTLGGVVYEFGTSPSCVVSETFLRAENASEGHGQDWFWQSARIEYEVTKYAPFE